MFSVPYVISYHVLSLIGIHRSVSEFNVMCKARLTSVHCGVSGLRVMHGGWLVFTVACRDCVSCMEVGWCSLWRVGIACHAWRLVGAHCGVSGLRVMHGGWLVFTVACLDIARHM